MFEYKSLPIDHFREKNTNVKGKAKRPNATKKQTSEGYIRSAVIRTLTADIFQLGVCARNVLSWGLQIRSFMLIG